MLTATTVATLCRTQADALADRPALEAPGRPPTTYAALHSLVLRTRDRLRLCGVGPDGCVAAILTNGPVAASAFAALSASAAYAPLNPAYRRAELDFYLSDLRPGLLVIDDRAPSDAREVARARGIPVASIRTSADAPAGDFELELDPAGAGSRATDAQTTADDVALVLHTSGTTARPKMVPLRQGNLCASARHIEETLRLTEDDRSLVVMPLFHIHGLIASVLATWASGGTVICPGPYEPDAFFGWLDATQPTWYSAVPTIHQAVLARANEHAALLKRTRLRFLRSSSSALPPRVMAELEKTFGVPVVESYGMTEAAHQMASNPLPPGERKPGSVGVAAGPEIAIMAPDGALLPAETVGEVVIRGPNVMRGYAANPAANETAFTNGWFRTGDFGTLDESGYLRLGGRIKELINRGGEKIAPREIDDVLLEHPAVRQAVAFPLAHPTLGEDIAAAIVLRAGVTADAGELREFVAARLATFKVPGVLVIVDEIPKGPTGKLQRNKLAELLRDALAQHDAVAPPASPAETTLAEIFARVLGIPVAAVGANSAFRTLGGDSIGALRVASMAAGEALRFSVEELQIHQTPRALARLAETRAAAEVAAIPASAGPMPAVGIMRENLYRIPRPAAYHHMTNELAFSAPRLDRVAFAEAVRAVVATHEMFRLRLDTSGPSPSLALASDPPDVPIEDIDLTTVGAVERAEIFARESLKRHRELDLDAGRTVRALIGRGFGPDADRVAFIVHHFVADGVSLGVLYDDLARAYAQALGGRPVALAPATSFRPFAEALRSATDAGELEADLAVWERWCGAAVPRLRVDGSGPNDVQSLRGIELDLDSEETKALRADALRRGVGLGDLVLAAFVQMGALVIDSTLVCLGVVSHGRSVLQDIDVSRSVGAFTFTVPLLVDAAAEGGDVVRAAKKQWEELPHGGVAIAAHLGSARQSALARLRGLPRPELLLNWRGVIRRDAADERAGFRRERPSWPRDRMWAFMTTPESVRDPYLVQVDAEVWDDRLETTWFFASNRIASATAENMASTFRTSLSRLVGIQ